MKLHRLILLSALLTVVASVSEAQTYPTRSVHMVIPFSPGGASDTVGRLVAEKMTDTLKQPVVVENVDGAATRIGATRVAKSPNDGYTVLVATSATLAIAPHLYRKMEYGLQDFEPITMLAKYPMAMVVSANSPIHDLKEFVAYAKAHPGQLSYGMAGIGGTAHLVGKMVEQALGISMTGVPYRGSAGMVPDLLGGRLDLYFDATAGALPLWKGGKVRILALTGAERMPGAESLPTFSESGYPNIVYYNTLSLVAPAHTPKSIVDQLNAAAVLALKNEDVRSRLLANGTQPNPTTPERASEEIKDEYDATGPMVRLTGVQLD